MFVAYICEQLELFEQQLPTVEFPVRVVTPMTSCVMRHFLFEHICSHLNATNPCQGRRPHHLPANSIDFFIILRSISILFLTFWQDVIHLSKVML